MGRRGALAGRPLGTIADMYRVFYWLSLGLVAVWTAFAVYEAATGL
jgi:hypothetical protein